MNKRKQSHYDETYCNKKIKYQIQPSNCVAPLGLVWDSVNYSCAYDAIFTILYALWTSDMERWSTKFNSVNKFLQKTALYFKHVNKNTMTFEVARDKVRSLLHQQHSDHLPYGQTGTDIITLATHLFHTNYFIATEYITCTQCDYNHAIGNKPKQLLFECVPTFKGCVREYVQRLLSKSYKPCYNCANITELDQEFLQMPPFILIAVNNADLDISKMLKFENDTEKFIYSLKGLIYFANFHFTARIITSDQLVWYHDGIETKNSCIYEGSLCLLKDRLQKAYDQNVVFVIYALNE